MSKIICDVCGTSYQDSATQCPICGCVRPADTDVNVQTNEARFTRLENYTYVKGGRFSKANVQKRNKGLLHDDTAVEQRSEAESAANAGKSDKGLVIAVCALLLAIVAVAVYIVIHFFAPSDTDAGKPDVQQGGATVQSTADATQEATVEDTTAVQIDLSQTEVTFTFAGETLTLSVTVSPEDTSGDLAFVSDDESVVTVSADGEVVAVAEGETTITVSCGEASAQCKVVCSFEKENTVAPTDPTTAAGNYKAPYKINKSDVSISVGETFQLKLTDAKGEIVPVTWSPAVADICKIDGNSITGAEKGKTEISATYDGETYTCIVRVR